MARTAMEIRQGNLDDQTVIKLIDEHIAEMYAVTDPQSVHSLDANQLKVPGVTFLAVGSIMS